MAAGKSDKQESAANEFREFVIDAGIRAFDRLAESSRIEGKIGRIVNHWKDLDEDDKRTFFRHLVSGAEAAAAAVPVVATATAAVKKLRKKAAAAELEIELEDGGSERKKDKKGKKDGKKKDKKKGEKKKDKNGKAQKSDGKKSKPAATSPGRKAPRG